MREKCKGSKYREKLEEILCFIRCSGILPKNCTLKEVSMERRKKIITAGIVGIIVNAVLSGFKYFVGRAVHSVSMTTDAINNFSDALSSLITIIGTQLAGKEPDRKHPFGYGRIEHISTLFISILIVYAGISALQESVSKLISPETPEHSAVSLTVIGVALAVRFLLGLYTKRQGKKLDADALCASGQDALNDCIVSAAILAAAVFYLFTGINIESYLGIIMSVIIIKAGIGVMKDTVSGILGERISPELADRVKGVISSFPEVKSVHDLIIHSYGVDRLLGSVHIQIPEVMRAAWIDNLEHHITDRVYAETGVQLTGISVYSVNMSDEETLSAYEKVKEMIDRHGDVANFHGFYIDHFDKVIRFDVIYDFETKDKKERCETLRQEVAQAYPEYDVQITLEYDFSE